MPIVMPDGIWVEDRTSVGPTPMVMVRSILKPAALQYLLILTIHQVPSSSLPYWVPNVERQFGLKIQENMVHL